MLELERHANGPRVRVLGQRVHHGAIGCALLACAPSLRKGKTRLDFYALACIGILACAHDVHDAPLWFAIGAQRED